jgi:hypothetical protein
MKEDGMKRLVVLVGLLVTSGREPKAASARSTPRVSRERESRT